tara:strand:+ start:762 stop:2435 length:1674 start_codon:yes stop_codon:yes gene_type:complete
MFPARARFGKITAVMTPDPILQQALSAIRQQHFADAIVLLEGLLNRQPGNIDARWLLVKTLESAANPQGAEDQLRQLLLHMKKNLPAIDQVAAYVRQRGYPLKHVLTAYSKYIETKPGSANAAFNYAFNLARDGQFEKSIEAYKRALKCGIDAPEEVHLNIANIYMDHLHASEQAQAHLQQAIKLNPAYASAYYNLGNLSEQLGDRPGASENFEKALQLDPGNDSALARLADTKVFSDQDDPLLTQLASRAQDSRSSDLHMALGKAYEQVGRFDLAWQHFNVANAQDRKCNPAYSREKTESMFAELKKQYSDEAMLQRDDSVNAPVFIAGMFRSGSTLLEQVLASHSRFVAGGESEFFPRLVAKAFPAYPQGLDSIPASKLHTWRKSYEAHTRKIVGPAQRLTDKRPDNFLYAGLIKALVPSARFVFTDRDWRDIATSIYSVRLGHSQPYATRLDDIRHYIELQADLVQFWAELLGPDLRIIRYEDLVQQPQDTVSGLLQWLGESWEDSCLSFHELKNSVRTASVWQVREPLHSKSIGRWRNYEQPFVDAFGESIKT